MSAARRWTGRENGQAEHKPTDYGMAANYRPASSTAKCATCCAFYVDDEDGHSAHRVVFGHRPVAA